MTFQIHKFGFQSTSELSFDDFQDAVNEAVDMSNGACWALGDLYNISRQRDFSEQAFDLRKKSLSTIQNYATVARVFPKARRKFDVSFSHYYEAKSLKDDEGNPLAHLQDNLLRLAELHDWNRDTMREKVRQARGQTTERKTIEAQVGIVDELLQKDYGLPIGMFVKVTFEIVTVQEDSEQEAA